MLKVESKIAKNQRTVLLYADEDGYVIAEVPIPFSCAKLAVSVASVSA